MGRSAWTPAAGMLTRRPAKARIAKASPDVLQEDILLVWAQVLFHLKEILGQFLFQGILQVIDDRDLGRNVGFRGLRLAQHVKEALPLVGDFLAQLLNLLAMGRIGLAQEVLLLLIQVQRVQQPQEAMASWRRRWRPRWRLIAEIEQGADSPHIEGQGKEEQIKQPGPFHEWSPFSRSGVANKAGRE